jgi:hypothetical protein
MDHSELDERLAGCRKPFVVLTQATVEAQPGEGTLYNPTLRQNMKARRERQRLDVWQHNAATTTRPPMLHNLDTPGRQLFSSPSAKMSVVAAVGPQLTTAPEVFGQVSQYQARTIAVGDIGGVDSDAKEQPLSIDHDVALATADLLARDHHKPGARLPAEAEHLFCSSPDTSVRTSYGGPR